MIGISPLAADAAQIALWAIVSGAVSMLLYKITSPQRRLKELESDAAAARMALAQHEGEFHQAWPLLRHSLLLALRRVRCALAPSLLAGLPVLLAICLIDDKLSQVVLPFGPTWLQSGWVVFFSMTCLAALIIKIVFRIK